MRANWLRHFFALGPVLVVLPIVVGLIGAGRTQSRPARTVSRGELAKRDDGRGIAAASVAIFVWAEAGAIYFMVDAFRRKYRTGRAPAYALAIMGPLTLGGTSLVYYAVWGRRPIESEAEVFGTLFCPDCTARSTDRSAPGTFTYNFVLGTRFMGSAGRCPDCKSEVRTLWLWLGLPVLPLGSYRLIATDTDQYVGRRTGLWWPHVFAVYAVAVAVVLIIRLLATRAGGAG